MNREELIDKAGDAMCEATGGELLPYDDMAQAALAVFEQAHTPTEAHEKPFDTSPERVKIGADSSHVTPSDAERAALLQAADRMSPLSANPHTSLDLALVREAAYRVADGTFRRTVQGEPTPVRFVARQGGKAQSTIDVLLAQANEHGIRVEVVYPQGEPTDAQAEAWWEGVNDQWKHRPIGNRIPEVKNPYRK